MEKSVLLEEPGGTSATAGKPPSNHPTLSLGKYYAIFVKYTHVLRRWFFGDVYGHPKNLLDFKRQVTRCGPFGIF